MQDEKKNAVFIARLTNRIKNALSELATNSGQSMSEYVEKLIEREHRKAAAKERRKAEEIS